jgi:hypothetical protein
MGKREVSITDYLAMVERMIRAAGRRVAWADPEDLSELIGLKFVLQEAIDEAVIGLRATGITWGSIGVATGTSRQAAIMKWAHLEGIGPRGS